MSMQSDVHITAAQLKTHLDELRVKAHLGGMEAHDKLDALAREVAELGRKATHATQQAAHALLERIRELEATFIVRD